VRDTTPCLPDFNQWLMIGDTHSNIAAFTAACDYAVRHGIEGLISVGDFNVLPRVEESIEFIIEVHRLLEAHGLWLLLIEGNHDDHTTLEYLPRDDRGMGILGPRARHASRGLRFTIRRREFLAVGGAVSVDQAHRTLGVDWFDDEALSFADVNRCIDGGPADVIIAHDCPEGVPDIVPATNWSKGDVYSAANRRAVLAIVEATRPVILFHGHHHVRYTNQLVLSDGTSVQVEGLGHDHSGDDLYTVLDLYELFG
jgi:predicted phosphodiesterase